MSAAVELGNASVVAPRQLSCCGRPVQRGAAVDPKKTFLSWPVVRQVRSGDFLGRGPAVTSAHTRELAPRTATADKVVQSVCPYCAVGCGQRVFVKDGHVVQIEGDPDSPVSRGRLCPKGSASEQLVNSPRATDLACPLVGVGPGSLVI